MLYIKRVKNRERRNMQINFTGNRVEITSFLRNYATEKLTKLDHLEKITALNMSFFIEKLRHTVKANLRVRGGIIHAEANADDLYTAVDKLVDKLDGQVIKHKEKQKRHIHNHYAKEHRLPLEHTNAT